MKQSRNISIGSLLGMIIATFLPWYSFNFSGSLNLGAYGSQSGSINQSINGIQATNVGIVFLLAIVGLLLCFIKPIKYLSFIIGVISVAVSLSFLFHWIGLPMNFSQDIHTGDGNYGMSANSSVSNGFGLYLLLISSIIYCVSVFRSSEIQSLIQTTNDNASVANNTNQTSPVNVPQVKISKKTMTLLIVCLIVLGVGFVSYKIYDKTRVYKISSIDELTKEFDANNAATIEKYKGHTIEFTGAFSNSSKFFDEKNPPDFIGVTNNQQDIRVHIQTGVDNNFLTTNSIYPIMSNDLCCDKNTNKIYEAGDNIKNIANRITAILNLKDPVIDTNTYNQNYLNSALNDCDEGLKKAIQTNSISLYTSDTINHVVDKITIQGKLINFEKGQNGFGQSVIMLSMENMKIVNKERVIDFSKLPVLDYSSAQKILANKLNYVRSMSNSKPQTDTTTIKQDTVKG